MSHTRALRRHHAARIKHSRRKYSHVFDSTSARVIGIVARTPSLCSCHMCGHQRELHGPNMQEVRARLRWTD